MHRLLARSQVTILHVSGFLFDGARAAGRGDTVFSHLRRDLATLADTDSLRPDLIIVTGDLASRGMPDDYRDAKEFLAELLTVTGVPKRQVALIPGRHDVNLAACKGHFFMQESKGRAPEPPYRLKWEQFANAFNEFYSDSDSPIEFRLGEPWTLFDMPALGLAVAGLNSTMAVSHENEHASLTEKQVRSFAAPLARLRDQGQLRLAAIHHASQQDMADLDTILGQTKLLNVLVSGQPGGPRALRSGVPVLATGSIGEDGRYQFITVRPNHIERFSRLYDAEGWRPDGIDVTPYAITDAQVVFGSQPVAAVHPHADESAGNTAWPPRMPVLNVFNGATNFALRDLYSAGSAINLDRPPGRGTGELDAADTEGQP